MDRQIVRSVDWKMDESVDGLVDLIARLEDIST